MEVIPDMDVEFMRNMVVISEMKADAHNIPDSPKDMSLHAAYSMEAEAYRNYITRRLARR